MARLRAQISRNARRPSAAAAVEAGTELATRLISALASGRGNSCESLSTKKTYSFFRSIASAAVSRARVKRPYPRRTGQQVASTPMRIGVDRSEEHTSELQSHLNLVCRLLLEKKKKNCYTLR